MGAGVSDEVVVAFGPKKIDDEPKADLGALLDPKIDEGEEELADGPNVAPPKALDFVVKLPKADPLDTPLIGVDEPNALGRVARLENADVVEDVDGGANGAEVEAEKTFCDGPAAGGGAPRLLASHSVAPLATGAADVGSGAISSSTSVISSVIVPGLFTYTSPLPGGRGFEIPSIISGTVRSPRIASISSIQSFPKSPSMMQATR